MERSVSQRDTDLEMLNELLEKHADELTGDQVEAFAGMRFTLTAGFSGSKYEQLTDKQRKWVTEIHEQLVPQYANLVSRGLVPRGKEVPDPPALAYRPTKPPPRQASLFSCTSAGALKCICCHHRRDED
jgi:hypothetical protein